MSHFKRIRLVNRKQTPKCARSVSPEPRGWLFSLGPWDPGPHILAGRAQGVSGNERADQGPIASACIVCTVIPSKMPSSICHVLPVLLLCCCLNSCVVLVGLSQLAVSVAGGLFLQVRYMVQYARRQGGIKWNAPTLTDRRAVDWTIPPTAYPYTLACVRSMSRSVDVWYFSGPRKFGSGSEAGQGVGEAQHVSSSGARSELATRIRRQWLLGHFQELGSTSLECKS